MSFSALLGAGLANVFTQLIESSIGNAMAAPDYPITRGSFSAAREPMFMYDNLFNQRARAILVHPFGIRVTTTQEEHCDAMRISLEVRAGVRVQVDETRELNFNRFTRNIQIGRHFIEDHVNDPTRIRDYLMAHMEQAAHEIQSDYNQGHHGFGSFHEARLAYYTHREDRMWERNHRVEIPQRRQHERMMRETVAELETYGRRLEIQQSRLQAAQAQAHRAEMAAQQAINERHGQWASQQGLGFIAGGLGQAANMRPGQIMQIQDAEPMQRQFTLAEYEREMARQQPQPNPEREAAMNAAMDQCLHIREIFGVGGRTIFHRTDTPAEEKALELLGELIDEEVLDKYKKSGALWVPGKEMNYVLYRDGDVIAVRGDNPNGFSYCVGSVTKYECPPTDNVIALKTMIETSESEFLRRANFMGAKVINSFDTIAGYEKGAEHGNEVSVTV